MSRVPLEIDLLPGLAQSLVAPLRRLMEKLGDRLPRPMQEPEDPDLQAILERDLLDGFQRDAGRLLAVLDDPAFGSAGYSLEAGEVEEMVRGCSGVRLLLREVALADVSDGELEEGAFDPADLSPEQRESHACFWFLGALQELLITLLDPESASGGAFVDPELE